MNDVTSILSAIEQGDPQAAEGLLPLVYEELRKLAAQRLAQEKPGQTLQATALVHEAYLRLVGGDRARAGTAAATSSPPRPRPCAASSSTRPAASRPTSTAAAWLRVELPDGARRARSPASDDLVALDEALGRLEDARPRGRPAGEAALLRRPVAPGGRRGPGHQPRLPPTASGRWAGPGCSANCRNSWPRPLFPRAGRRHFSH